MIKLNSGVAQKALISLFTFPLILGISHHFCLPSLAEVLESEAEVTNGDRQRVYFAENRVSFIPPAGFTPMTAEEIAIKFPSGNQPQYVYANAARNVSIAITFSQANLLPEQLPEFREFLESFLQKFIPGLKWIERDFVEINAYRWLKLEATSKASDTDIHNDMYFTSFEGKMLGFNFNSTLAQKDAVRSELLTSRDTITIEQ